MDRPLPVRVGRRAADSDASALRTAPAGMEELAAAESSHRARRSLRGYPLVGDPAVGAAALRRRGRAALRRATRRDPSFPGGAGHDSEGPARPPGLVLAGHRGRGPRAGPGSELPYRARRPTADG